MRIERAIITPQIAKDFLAANYEKQRHININWVETIANDIKAGRWDPNVPNSAIVISKQGQMLDGQHRCEAIVKANIPVNTHVIYDVDAASFETIDNGMSRNAKDFINCRNNVVVTALARFAVCIECGSAVLNAARGRIGKQKDNSMLKPSRVQILDQYKRNESYLEEIASRAVSVNGKSKLGTKSSYAFAMWLIDYVDDDKEVARLYFEELEADMQTTQATSKVVRKLMQMAIDKEKKKASFPNEVYLSVLLAGYDRFKDGKQLTALDVKKAGDVWDRKVAIARMKMQHEKEAE